MSWANSARDGDSVRCCAWSSAPRPHAPRPDDPQAGRTLSTLPSRMRQSLLGRSQGLRREGPIRSIYVQFQKRLNCPRTRSQPVPFHPDSIRSSLVSDLSAQSDDLMSTAPILEPTYASLFHKDPFRVTRTPCPTDPASLAVSLASTSVSS
eukprot:1003615-Rhodomonas_salina.2